MFTKIGADETTQLSLYLAGAKLCVLDGARAQTLGKLLFQHSLPLAATLTQLFHNVPASLIRRFRSNRPGVAAVTAHCVQVYCRPRGRTLFPAQKGQWRKGWLSAQKTVCATLRALSLFVQAVAAPLMCLSIIREIASFEVAPTTRSSSLPPLKRIKVGMPLIP